jgi:hypothetical protein
VGVVPLEHQAAFVHLDVGDHTEIVVVAHRLLAGKGRVPPLVYPAKEPLLEAI